MKKNVKKGPKILVLDIETSPIIAHVWGLWDNNVGLNQIQQDWHVMSVAAKWVGEKKVFYADQRNAKDITNDKKVLEMIWKLMDEADLILGQNQKAFDVRKLNARFILNGMKPPSSYRQIDTKLLAKKNFAFTSNKLEYMSDKLCTKTKKLKHNKYPGHTMWVECMKGNLDAWKHMQKYNIADILATEELYLKLAPWGTGINMNVYSDIEDAVCSSCGGTKFTKNGFRYTNSAKYQRYTCTGCGSEHRSPLNELPKTKTKGMARL